MRPESHQTLALYKSFTYLYIYLLTYLLTYLGYFCYHDGMQLIKRKYKGYASNSI